jgi:hypothetical protein
MAPGINEEEEIICLKLPQQICFLSGEMAKTKTLNRIERFSRRA